jgi:hypothetical protein
MITNTNKQLTVFQLGTDWLDNAINPLLLARHLTISVRQPVTFRITLTG